MDKNRLCSLVRVQQFGPGSPAFRIAVVGVIYPLMVLAPPPIAATTFTVANRHDSGPGSLRQAIADANVNPGSDTITFAVRGTISLTSGQLVITDDLTIVGPGGLTVSGNYASRVFDIEGSTVTISGLTISDGLADATAPHGSIGGGIYNAGGKTLTLSRVVLSNNVALGGTGSNGEGGGLATVLSANVIASQVTIKDNLASGSCNLGSGGGLFIDSGATLSLAASHVTRNIAAGNPGVGGGVYNLGTLSFDKRTVITGNRASTSNYNIFP
jgi:hypothetical protein